MKDSIKKVLINIGCALVLFGVSFTLGRFIRVKGAEDKLQQVEYNLEQSELKAANLKSSLEQRIEECEQYIKDAQNIQKGIDNCKSINETMSNTIQGLNVSSNNINDLIKQLKQRYKELETQNELMKQKLESISK